MKSGEKMGKLRAVMVEGGERWLKDGVKKGGEWGMLVLVGLRWVEWGCYTSNINGKNCQF